MTLLLLLMGCTSTEGPIVYRFVPDFLASDELHELTLDIATPDPAVHGEGPYPGVVYFHGGGWLRGNLYDDGLQSRIKHAADRGYVALTANYRLTGLDDQYGGTRFPWPAQISDARCAVRWLRSRAAQYRVDIDHIGAVGLSMGGHLALTLATADRIDTFEDGCGYPVTSEVQAAVSWGGPTNLTTLYPDTTELGRSYIRRLLSLPDFHTPEVDPAPYRDASPLFWSREGSAPVLMLHGTEDTLVPMSDPDVLLEDLVSHDVPALLTRFDGQEHALRGAAAKEAQRREDAWLDRHLKGEDVSIGCSPWPSCR